MRTSPFPSDRPYRIDLAEGSNRRQPRRRAPYRPACPYCGTVHARMIDREGLSGRLTVFQCDACKQSWREVVSDTAVPEADV